MLRKTNGCVKSAVTWTARYLPWMTRTFYGPPITIIARCTLIPYLDEVPADAPQPSSDTVDFINNWSDNYFDIPAFYARDVA